MYYFLTILSFSRQNIFNRSRIRTEEAWSLQGPHLLSVHSLDLRHEGPKRVLLVLVHRSAHSLTDDDLVARHATCKALGKDRVEFRRISQAFPEHHDRICQNLAGLDLLAVWKRVFTTNLCEGVLIQPVVEVRLRRRGFPRCRAVLDHEALGVRDEATPGVASVAKCLSSDLLFGRWNVHFSPLSMCTCSPVGDQSVYIIPLIIIRVNI